MDKLAYYKNNYDINSKDTIYYGTQVENIYKLDKYSIDKPFIRSEKFISVSISGFIGYLPVTSHDEIEFLSNIYSKKYNAADIDDNKIIHWKTGYKNSLTYIDGFGPSDMKHFNVFGETKINNRIGQNIVAIIDKKYITEIVNIEYFNKIKTDNLFEYLSLSLHGFIKRIEPKMILGWIVDEENFEQISKDMTDGKLSNKPLYIVDNII